MDTRARLVSMMRDYQLKGVAFFTGEDILSVEVISGLDKTFFGCVVSLTSWVPYIVLDTRRKAIIGNWAGDVVSLSMDTETCHEVNAYYQEIWQY